MDNNRSVRERLEELEEAMQGGKPKPKKFRMPVKAKVSKGKMKKGYATVMVINENKNVDFTREPIVDSTIKLKDSFHAIDSEDVLFYQGKPLLIQAKNKANPYNPLEGKHETYGQKYILARMEGDKIITKKQLSWMAIILGGLVAIGILYWIITG